MQGCSPSHKKRKTRGWSSVLSSDPIQPSDAPSRPEDPLSHDRHSADTNRPSP
ncbi:hypothetical protein BN2537_3653 [Streptomyces venezuelae]|nr:hypothetical protein BN2537_3653 [Streptomyces venezuelae]